MESVYIREQDKIAERIRNLEKGKKELLEEIEILKKRLAALENERQSLSVSTQHKKPIRKRKKAIETPV